MSPSNYPGGLDSHETNHADGVSEIIHADDINDLGDAINKIEAELGTDPSSPSATVKARLDAISLGNAPYDLYTLNGATSAGATSITVDRSVTLATSGSTYVAIDPFTTGCEIRRATTISGVTISGLTALGSAHSSARVVLLFQGNAVPAAWFGAKGDNSTDDTVALQQGLNQVGPLQLELDGASRQHVIGQPLLLGPDQRIAHFRSIKAAATFAPAEANNAMLMNCQRAPTTFTAAASTDIFTTPAAHGIPADGGAGAVVFKGTSLPTGITAGKLYYARDRTATTFKVSATIGGAAVNLTADGSGTAYTEVVSLQKVYVDDVYVNGNNVAGLNGAMFYLQQQAELKKFRIDSCLGTGLHLIGQQAVFLNFESVNCGKAVVLDNASFMYFYGCNLENFTTGIHIITAAQSPSGYGGGAFNCGIWGGHFERNSSASVVFFDHEGTHSEIIYDNFSVSSNTNGAKVWFIHTGSPVLSGYLIRKVRFVTGGTTNRPTAISDTDRSVTLDAWDDFRNHILEFHAPVNPSSAAYTDAQPYTIAGPAGRSIKYGGTQVGVPSFVLQAGTGQTAAQMVWRTSAGTDAAWIDKGGYLTIALHSAPADGDLAAGQMAIWIDQTNGAAKLMVKAKEAGGTVRTGSVSLT